MASSELRFNFKGKSGKTWRLQVKDRRVARVVKACQELPGQHLFQYIDADSESRAVTSSDVEGAVETSIDGASLRAAKIKNCLGRSSPPRLPRAHVHRRRAKVQLAALRV